MIFSPLDYYETKEYHRLTVGMRFVLPKSFIHHCEQIIFGNEYKDLSYFCFHLYTDTNYREEYEKLSQAMEYAYTEVESSKFRNLSNNISNLLIFLREPKARENDYDYTAKNLEYWRDMVTDDALLQNKSSFRKYFNLKMPFWFIFFLLTR